MSEDGKGDTSTTSILLLAGAIGIGIWFLTVAADFVDSGTSPVYAVFFFAPICGVFLVVVVLAEVMKSLSGSSKNNTELGGENTSSDTSGREGKNDISFKQILVILAIVAVILFVFMVSLAGGFEVLF
jgi:phosphate/sulfate permease